MNAEDADQDVRSVSFTYTEDEFIAAYRAIRMARFESYDSLIVRIGVAFVGHVLLLAGILVRGPLGLRRERRERADSAGSGCFQRSRRRSMAVGLHNSIYFRRNRLRSLYRSFPLRDDKVLYGFTPLRFQFQHRLGQGSVDWSLIPKVAELKDGFVVQATMTDGEWIPRHAIDEPFGDVEVAEFLRSRVKAYRTINRFAGLSTRGSSKKPPSWSPDPD